jgi:hypothetical protein
MSQIPKFPDAVRRQSNDGPPREVVTGRKDRTITKMILNRPVPVMAGDQWKEFIRLLTPDRTTGAHHEIGERKRFRPNADIYDTVRIGHTPPPIWSKESYYRIYYPTTRDETKQGGIRWCRPSL